MTLLMTDSFSPGGALAADSGFASHSSLQLGAGFENRFRGVRIVTTFISIVLHLCFLGTGANLFYKTRF